MIHITEGRRRASTKIFVRAKEGRASGNVEYISFQMNGSNAANALQSELTLLPFSSIGNIVVRRGLGSIFIAGPQHIKVVEGKSGGASAQFGTDISPTSGIFVLEPVSVTHGLRFEPPKIIVHEGETVSETFTVYAPEHYPMGFAAIEVLVRGNATNIGRHSFRTLKERLERRNHCVKVRMHKKVSALGHKKI